MRFKTRIYIPDLFIKHNYISMKKYTLLFGILFSLAFSQLYGQINVTHIETSAAAPASDGIIYVLPRTVIKVDVAVRIDEHLKGPLSEYAERFFGIDDAINFDNSSYEIEDLSISTQIEPDPKQAYYIQASYPSSKELKMLLVVLDESGYLVSANNLDAELFSEENSEQIVISEEIEFDRSEGDFLINSKIRAKVDTIIRKVAVDTVMTQKLFYRTRIVDKTNEELASEAMFRIQELREARHRLLTGFQETAYSAATIAYMDGELKKQETEYMALFRGKSFSSYDQFTFYYIPENSTGSNAANLFNFASNTGVSEAGGAAGEKVMLKFDVSGLAEVMSSLPEAGKTENYTPGIFYRIPETAEVSLVWDDEVLIRTRVTVNQFGTVRNIEGNDFKIEMHPTTGGVKSIVVK